MPLSVEHNLNNFESLEINQDETFVGLIFDFMLFLNRRTFLGSSILLHYYLTEVSKTRQYRIPLLLLVNRTFPAGFL